MADEPIKSSKRVLDPIDRVSEVLLGLIMVLTFTGSLSIAEAGRYDVRTMLIGALGCLQESDLTAMFSIRTRTSPLLCSRSD
jgi:hypothetical protein